MSEHKNSSVAKGNAVHDEMSSGLARTATLLGGTTAMREAGVAYLPMEPKEEKAFYNNRKARTVLFNAFKKTQGVLAGKVFNKGVQLKDADSDPFKTWFEDIDLEGNDLSQFSYEFFKRGLSNGVDYVLIDIPKPILNENNTPLSAAQEKEQNIRPYFVSIKASNLLGWKTEVINGIKTLIQIRIRETVREAVPDDEFADVEIEQIRVQEPNLVTIYRKKKTSGKEDEWFIFDTFITTIDFIPLVPFYAGKLGFFFAESPLMDLAHLNIDHWQKVSDLSNILHLIQVPILVASGVDKDFEVTIGPNTLQILDQVDSSLNYIEPTGEGVKLGQLALEAIENQMAVMGASMLVDRPGLQTATQKAINEGGSNSDLAAMAKNFEDTLNTAFTYMLRVINDTSTIVPTVTMNTDYGVPGMGAINVEQLLKLRITGTISQETFINKLNELTGFDINAEEEVARLITETPDIADAVNSDNKDLTIRERGGNNG